MNQNKYVLSDHDKLSLKKIVMKKNMKTAAQKVTAELNVALKKPVCD